MEQWLDQGGRFDRFTRWVAFLGLVGLLAVALGTMGDVLLRWLFNSPIEGFEEVSELTFAIIVAACFPAGLIQGHNITIRLLGKGLGRRADQWLEAFGHGPNIDLRLRQQAQRGYFFQGLCRIRI